MMPKSLFSSTRYPPGHHQGAVPFRAGVEHDAVEELDVGRLPGEGVGVGTAPALVPDALAELGPVDRLVPVVKATYA